MNLLHLNAAIMKTVEMWWEASGEEEVPQYIVTFIEYISEGTNIGFDLEEGVWCRVIANDISN